MTQAIESTTVTKASYANNVLAKIVDDKRAEIAQRETDFPLQSFIRKLKPCNKSFIEALSQPNAGFIFECKKASPSKGLIREHFDLDEIVSAYEKEAACFSVLTDEKYFQGKFEYLEYVTARVKQPVLNKDFFVVPYQIYLARFYNADAVLLMLSVLSDDEYRELSSLAFELGMEVLTEVSNEEETARALALHAKIIGINNRDLRDLSTDLATTERLVPQIRATDFDGVIISESGIYTHQDLLRLNHLVDGYLVGSSLMAQADLNRAVSQLAYGEVKVCGVTQKRDAHSISQTPASYMGLIFAQKSPRYVNLEQAASICAHAPFNYVGVFVDAPIKQLVEYVNRLDLCAVQLHGNEDKQYIHELATALHANNNATAIWKVLPVEADDTAEHIQQRLDSIEANEHIDRILFDCKVGQQSGGTGQPFNWDLLAHIKTDKQVVLAGGISPDNASAARRTLINTRTSGLKALECIDVNSKVEDAPGIKNTASIEHLFATIRI
ncbi:bifunctional indole-3-glycerol-phosphate synthase TrpC/phosphoribosylanthranilate isomerase TrpF [Ningiella sp. W23]|uniref:bifunctional indole-3-glycerol-phosphate synthase TrpC/phosphoribosylanthranilate isomerase TrpF n=1 Tax=Ningiella sp. W23 TaxID=3023715 RepID=UPI0037566AD3